MPAPDARWPDARLHVVTGKGGTGKTVVASALAVALASGGAKVLLVETEGRQGIAQQFDTAPLPYKETPIAPASGGGEVFALALDAEQALLEYLDVFYGMRRAGWALRRTGALDFATTIAPGVKDVLVTGKVKELMDRADDDRTTFDAIVLDAPPTGRVVRFLTVTAEVAGLARVGPIRSQSESVARTMTSPATVLHVVTLLEEMPVQETAEAMVDMREQGLHIGQVVVNRVREPHLPDDALADAATGRLSSPTIASGLERAELPSDDGTVAGLLAETREHAQRVMQEKALREKLRHLDRPVTELPNIPGRLDPGDLYQLASTLRADGVRTARFQPQKKKKKSDGKGKRS